MGETKLAKNLEEGDVINASGVYVTKVLPVFMKDIVHIHLSNGEYWRVHRSQKIAVFQPTSLATQQRGDMYFLKHLKRRYYALAALGIVALVMFKASENDSFPWIPSKEGGS